jgi:hypothetical protein
LALGELSSASRTGINSIFSTPFSVTTLIIVPSPTSLIRSLPFDSKIPTAAQIQRLSASTERDDRAVVKNDQINNYSFLKSFSLWSSRLATTSRK